MRIKIFDYIIIFYHICRSGAYLHDKTILLMDAAIQAIGVLGKTYSLPLPAEGDDELNKKAVMETLFFVLSNAKLSTKVRFPNAQIYCKNISHLTAFIRHFR